MFHLISKQRSIFDEIPDVNTKTLGCLINFSIETKRGNKIVKINFKFEKIECINEPCYDVE